MNSSIDTGRRGRSRSRHSGFGEASSATPVNDLSTTSQPTTSRPAAGSMMIRPLRVTRSSTTKWFISQCRMAGFAKVFSPPIPTRKPRAASPMPSAMVADVQQGLAASAVLGEAPDAIEVVLATKVLADGREARQPALVEFAGQHHGHATRAEQTHLQHQGAFRPAPRPTLSL